MLKCLKWSNVDESWMLRLRLLFTTAVGTMFIHHSSWYNVYSPQQLVQCLFTTAVGTMFIYHSSWYNVYSPHQLVQWPYLTILHRLCLCPDLHGFSFSSICTDSKWFLTAVLIDGHCSDVTCTERQFLHDSNSNQQYLTI